MIRKAVGVLIGLTFYFFGAATPLLAATNGEEHGFERPFNVLWLAVFLMAIAVFLSLAHWRSSEEI